MVPSTGTGKRATPQPRTRAAAPAAARDYPYCLRGGGYGYTGDCSYTSYAQCQASASGRRAYCDVNPLFAFGEQRRGRPYRSY